MHIHASPFPTRSRILCPCLEQKSTREQARYGHQQRPLDSNWLPETHPCVQPASPCWNCPGQSLRQDAATLTLARKAQKYDWHILHKATITPAPPGRLKSCHPYNKAAQEMLQSIPEDLSRDAWLAASWKQTWETAGPSRIQQYIRDPGGGVKGEDLPRHLWTSLNHLFTGVGRFKSSLKKWGLSDSAACECGEPEQTAKHIITGCPLYSPPSEAGLFDLGPETRAWLHDTELAI